MIDILRRFNAESELKILLTLTGQQATRMPRNKTSRQNERIKRTVQGSRAANIVSYCRYLGYLNE